MLCVVSSLFPLSSRSCCFAFMLFVLVVVVAVVYSIYTPQNLASPCLSNAFPFVLWPRFMCVYIRSARRSSLAMFSRHQRQLQIQILGLVDSLSVGFCHSSMMVISKGMTFPPSLPPSLFLFTQPRPSNCADPSGRAAERSLVIMPFSSMDAGDETGTGTGTELCVHAVGILLQLLRILWRMKRIP